MILVGAVLLHLPPVKLFYIFLVDIVTFFCLANFESIIFSCFTSICNFKTTLRAKVDSENKEYLMKIQTNEMRLMIGTY
jgi:hypothetical protein